MSREIERRRETHPVKGVQKNENDNLSRILANLESKNKGTSDPSEKKGEKEFHRFFRNQEDKENQDLRNDTTGDINRQGLRDVTNQSAYNGIQTDQTTPIDRYYSESVKPQLEQLTKFAQQAAWAQAYGQKQVAHAQELDRQLAEMQTSPNTSEISNIVPQERVTNPNGKRKREALGDGTNTYTNDPDSRATKRARSDNPHIDEISANPATGEQRKLSDIDEQTSSELRRIQMEHSKLMEQSKFDKEKMEEEVKKMLHDDKKEEQAKQQGLPPGSQGRDGSPTDSSKHDQKPEKNNSHLQTLQAKLAGERTQLNDAMSRLGQSDSQQIESLISQIQNAIQTTQGEISAAETEKP